MGFGNYENFHEAVETNQDKENAKAYAAALHHEATGEWPGQKAAGDVFDDRNDHLDALLTAAQKMGVEPDEDFIATVRKKAGNGSDSKELDEETKESDGSKGFIDRLLSLGN